MLYDSEAIIWQKDGRMKNKKRFHELWGMLERRSTEVVFVVA